MRKAVLASVLSIVVTIPTQAVVDDSKDPYLSVQGLLEMCKASSDAANSDLARGFCMGYISGIADMMSVTAHHAPAGTFRQEFGVCVEKGSSFKHKIAVETFKDWAEKHPKTWPKPYWYGVTRALAEARPCSDSSGE